MKLTRTIPGRFYCDGATTSWLADAEFDLSGFADAALPVTFVATVDVPSGAAGVFSVTAGGAAETTGATTLSSVAVTGPVAQCEVTGAALAGVSQVAGKVLLHVCAATSDASLPVEVTGITITIGTDD
jgi:hypothetical protein